MIGNYATNMTDTTSINTNHVAFIMKDRSASNNNSIDASIDASTVDSSTNDSKRDQQIAVFIKFLSDNFSKNDVSEMTITYRKKTEYSIVHYIKSLVNDSDFWINNALMACAMSIVFGYIWFNSL